MWKAIGHLIKHEFLLEFRQKHFLGATLIYLVASIYVCYLNFKKAENPFLWNALFWIILLFTAFNFIGKSFNSNRENKLYLYTLVNPKAIIFSKIIYNSILMIVLSLLSFVLYWLFFGGETLVNASVSQFLLALILGGLGFATSLTLIGSIAAQTDNPLALTAVLGFPVVLPLLLVLTRFSLNAIGGVSIQENSYFLMVLLAINGIIISLSYLLFPYLWKE